MGFNLGVRIHLTYYGCMNDLSCPYIPFLKKLKNWNLIDHQKTLTLPPQKNTVNAFAKRMWPRQRTESYQPQRWRQLQDTNPPSIGKDCPKRLDQQCYFFDIFITVKKKQIKKTIRLQFPNSCAIIFWVTLHLHHFSTPLEDEKKKDVSSEGDLFGGTGRSRYICTADFAAINLAGLQKF